MTNSEPAPYHHGALRPALLAAAEALLRENGVAALTLRSIARQAKVSHAAPAHHFADLAALLSELAAEGFRRLTERLAAALDELPVDRYAVARAYVRFALDNAALFTLMFRDDRLDAANPALSEARAAAVAVLSRVAGASVRTYTLEEAGAMASLWATIHGFAVLAVDGRLAALLRTAPAGTSLDDLMEAALRGSSLPTGMAADAEATCDGDAGGSAETAASAR